MNKKIMIGAVTGAVVAVTGAVVIFKLRNKGQEEGVVKEAGYNDDIDETEETEETEAGEEVEA